MTEKLHMIAAQKFEDMLKLTPADGDKSDRDKLFLAPRPNIIDAQHQKKKLCCAFLPRSELKRT